MREIYCDNHLLVLHKPAGVITQEMEGEESVESFGKRYLKEKMGKPGNVFLVPLHRLDRPVAGVVLCARTSKALSRLEEEKRQGGFRKTYEAVVEGELLEDAGVLEHDLVHGEFRAYEGRGGKRARLTYRVIERMRGKTRVEIHLETGRYHQIRAQFGLIGHPVCGDEKYGARGDFEVGAIALWHVCLEVTHPVTRARLAFSLQSNHNLF